MNIDDALFTEFARATKDEQEEKKESTVFGTVTLVDTQGNVTVLLDGAENPITCKASVSCAVDDRVEVSIKNRTALITSNFTHPSIGPLQINGDDVDIYGNIVAKSIKAKDEYDIYWFDPQDGSECYIPFLRVGTSADRFQTCDAYLFPGGGRGTADHLYIRTSITEAYNFYASYIRSTGSMSAAGGISTSSYISAAGNINGGSVTYSGHPCTRTDNNTVRDLQLVSSPYYLQVAGDAGAHGITVWDSDIRLKKNIEDSQIDALEVVENIRHRSFEWKASGVKNGLGYVAQELEEVIPDAVFYVKQENDDEIGQINHTIIIPYLSKAIQELSAEVKALKKEIEILKGSASNVET